MIPAVVIKNPRRWLLISALAAIATLTGCALPPTVAEVNQGNDIRLVLEVNEDYSCPYLFTWDGAAYSVENDIYSVARGESREYRDYLFIKNPVLPEGNSYIFELRERQSEQSWTDLIQLMVIDHPAELSAGADSSGQPHTYASPQPPLSAVDNHGHNMLSQLSAKDGLTADFYHGDAVVLDFSNVDITNGAKLVMDLNGFEGTLSGDRIPQVPAINIQTLEGGQWITRHQFFPKELWARASLT